MSIDASWNAEKNILIINVGDTFNYLLRREFRDAYIAYDAEGLTVKIGLSTTKYMDSAALGMLIQLRKYADSCKGEVVLCRPHGAVEKSLEIAQFKRLFTFEK